MTARHEGPSVRPRLGRAVRATLAATVAALSLGAGTAGGSVLLARDATNVRLAIDEHGMALVTYADGHRVRHVLVWGAINDTVRFKLDYSGGWKAFGRPVWKRFEDASLAYDGPPLPWLLVARRASDGSYWALQSWQRMLPNLGYTPWKSSQRAWELHISHWRGPPPQLEIWLDWVGRQNFQHLFGRFTYRDKAVFGASSTPQGRPLDPHGRNVYLDTFDSAYGSGWARENSFLTHRPNGNFCYGFYSHVPPRWYPPGPTRPPGVGTRYRATVIGPGVTPVVMWSGEALGEFDPEHERQMDELGEQIAAGDPRCQRH
jgi:hypothetical protein